MSETVAPASSAKQRRLFLIGSLVVAGAALGFISMGDIGENLVYYWNPTELREAGDKAIGASIRLGGVVKPGSVVFDDKANRLSFEVEHGSDVVRVENTGAPPQMFREGIGVVVEGTYTEEELFVSDRLMVKHSNEYRAPEDGVASEALYETVEGL